MIFRIENGKVKMRKGERRKGFSPASVLNFTLALAVLLSLAACWPTKMGFRDDSMPETWRTFFVEPLEMTSATAPSNYNAILTDDLRTGIQNNTRLKLAPDADSVQVLITGMVTGYNTSPLAIQEGDNAAQTRLTVTTTFTIVTPTRGLEKIQMTSSRFADFSSSLNLQDVESQLIPSINQQIVQDVINKLLSNW
jgi:hypothetical protein